MPKKGKNVLFYEAIGRRKASTARVRLYITTGKKEIFTKTNKIKRGEIIINEKPIGEYFQSKVDAEERWSLPLKLVESIDRFAVSIIIKGGGLSGQLDAVRLGIARALLLVDDSYRAILRKENLLSFNSRVKERRKPGTGGKARRKKQSPKR